MARRPARPGRNQPARKEAAPPLELQLKTFPVTVPLLGEASLRYFQPPAGERLSGERWILGAFPVRYSASSVDEMTSALGAPSLPGVDWFRLLYEAEELAAAAPAGAGELVAPRHLEAHWRRVGVIPYPHQLEAARRALFEMGGRAVLADEVGLGKTIEAGLIIKECFLRGLAERALILTPASLCWQWFYELKEKFDLPCSLQRSAYDWERSKVLVASIDTAKKSPHREIIANLHFDILVVDEAHKLKNARTASYRFVSGISRKYCLLLTATPVQNDLKELYNLIELIRPGHLGAYREFKAEFVHDMRTPKEPERLRALLSRLLIRSRKGKDTVQFTKRHVESVPVDLSPGERRLYDAVTDFVRTEYRRAKGTFRNVLPLVTLQREVCSSSIAAAVTLEKMMFQASSPELKERLAALRDLALATGQNSKADFLEEFVRGTDEKVIVFTEYRATQQYLRWRLEKAGISTLGFDGSLSASRKGWIRELFRSRFQVLVSTESGGEGLNFQFCRRVVNYDLPWNPMRIEQRIGRVHRLGQTRDVYVTNLATRDSIEEHVLFLLYEKINMFESILGELDAILSRLKVKGSLEKELADILIGSESEEDVKRRLDRLAEAILLAKGSGRDEDSWDRLLLW